MCRHHRRSEKEDDSLSPYDEHIDRFFNRVSDATSSLSDITKKVVGQTYDLASAPDRASWKEQREEFWRNLHNRDVDRYSNRPYQTRTGEGIGGILADPTDERDNWLGSPFDLFTGLLFGRSFGTMSAPSAREYNECVRKDGASVWDAEGYWRCLFPNSQLPEWRAYQQKHPNQITTKEDFEQAAAQPHAGLNGAVDLGPKGVFFRHYDDLLKWRDANYESERKQRELNAAKRKEALVKAQSEFDQRAKAADSEKRVVSTSVETATNTDPATKEVVMSERKTEVFSDGTSQSSSVVRRKPIGADSWTTVEQNSSEDDKKGWFWKSK